MGQNSKVETAHKSFAARANARWLTVGISFSLVLAVWMVFGQSLHFDFVNYDDNKFVTENPHVLNGLTPEDVKWAFRFDQGDYWHPLTWLSLMLDVNLFGKGAGGFHFTNVLLHTANSILLFLLLRRWTGTLWRSALVAALFAVHPLRVESVAWVTERKDVLSTLFWLLTLLAYSRYGDEIKSKGSKAKIFYGLTMLLFVLGLMSKAMLVTLPLMLLLLDYWPFKRIERLTLLELKSKLPHLLFEKIPLFLLSGISVGLTYWGQHRVATVPTPADLSLMLRMENVFIAYARYLEKTFWPVNLAIPYTHPEHWDMSEIIFSVALMVGLSVLAWQLRQRKPYIFVGWFWFLITLIPVIGLTKGWLQFMADRFTYVPLIGIFLLVVWGLGDLGSDWHYHRQVFGGCAAVILIALTIRAHRQTSYWRNSLALWTHTLACTSNNAIADTDFGGALLQAGKIDEAITNFQAALKIDPNDVRTHRNLGDALLQKGQTYEGIQHLKKALEINYKDAGSHLDLGAVLYQSGEINEAVAQYQIVLEIDPDNSKAHNNLGLALYRMGRMDEAIAQYQSALNIDPNNVEALFNLGNAFLQTRQFGGAISEYQRVLALNPNDAEAHNNLGLAFYQTNRTSEAIIQFQKSLEINPHDEQVRYNFVAAENALTNQPSK